MSDVEELVDNSTKEQRAALFDDLIGRLTNGETSLPSAAIEFCTATIIRLITVADASEHSFMSMRVARNPDLPLTLASALAKCNIAIAAPVLSLSNSLDEATILEIAGTCSEAHLLSIARRRELSQSICDALLRRGFVEVAIALTDNSAAKLSPWAIEILGKLAEKSPKLEEKLCGRADLPVKLAHRLMQTVKMRLHLQLGSTMSTFDPDAIRVALRTSEAETSSEVTDTQALSQDAMVTVAKLTERGELDEARFDEFIAEERLDLVTFAFARFSDIEPAIARRILLTTADETLAVASRAIPLSTPTYINLVRLTREDDPITDDMAVMLAERYEELSIRTARKVMQFHKKRRDVAASRRSEHSRPHDVALSARLGKHIPDPVDAPSR